MCCTVVANKSSGPLVLSKALLNGDFPLKKVVIWRQPGHELWNLATVLSIPGTDTPISWRLFTYDFIPRPQTNFLWASLTAW